jgi:hypothetical protein
MVITKFNLYTNQYDSETLKANIYAVSLLDILKTQRLTVDFCVKYILNETFQLLEEEQCINIEIVKKYQNHINVIELVGAIIRETHKKMIGEKIDSGEDFETYMNRHL